jgi:hypothetical protein
MPAVAADALELSQMVLQKKGHLAAAPEKIVLG